MTSYRNDGQLLAEVETGEVHNADAAIALGQSAFVEHPTVIVFRETVDAMGIIRSAVIHTFGQADEKL